MPHGANVIYYSNRLTTANFYKEVKEATKSRSNPRNVLFLSKRLRKNNFLVVANVRYIYSAFYI